MLDFSAILYKIAQALPGFLLAIVAHEWAHGYMALRFGDNTAKVSGRLTFNPVVHIDMMGTVIFPLIGTVLGWGTFGWAKPVPVDSRNFHPKKIDQAIFWVSFAGPLANIILGTFSALLVAMLAVYFPRESSFLPHMIGAASYSVMINFLLAGFNLIPFPPLDGSKMVASFLSPPNKMKYLSLQAYSSIFFMGIFALSMMGIPTLSYILSPIMGVGSFLQGFFLRVLGA